MSYSRRAEVYAVEYDETRDVEFVLSLAAKTGGRILEIPCGAGRLSRHLAPVSHSLTVVDLEPAMVARALDVARLAGRGAIVRGAVQDMRNLALDQTFDLCVIPREALQLVPQPDGTRVLAAVARHLAPGGQLLVDLANFGPQATDEPDPDYYWPDHEDGVLYENWSRPLQDGTILARSSRQAHSAGVIKFDLHYQISFEGLLLDGWQSQMGLHRYERSWLDQATPAGMEIEHVYGGYDRSVFGNRAPRMISIYRKPT